MKRLILTGDDFGLDVRVNEAIEEAHRHGVLTAASLMVAGDAAEDAVERARGLPTLKIGLHLVLVEGRPALPASEVPDLVDDRGDFSTRLVWSGFRFFFLPRVRRQMRNEIRAQFRAFRETGLALDHVNAHNHMHIHPTLLGLMLEVGREFGLRAVRLPREPALASWRAAGSGLAGRALPACLLGPLLAWMARRLRRAGLRFNDHLFGMRDSGRMEETLVLRQLRELPEGVSEMHFHLATRPSPLLEQCMPGYRHQAELAGLLSPAVRDAIAASGARVVAFSDLDN